VGLRLASYGRLRSHKWMTAITGVEYSGWKNADIELVHLVEIARPNPPNPTGPQPQTARAGRLKSRMVVPTSDLLFQPLI
jgi:hypothetical protein